ncbi:OB-fold nucleic acid binding domain-containing protein [Neobacillus drentensis]|uniref:OB-fold nucleic acid binding domain-containing protein n=1 Tax=Neobacillus drentensis TaxID=220684 RepID=UPI00300077AD
MKSQLKFLIWIIIIGIGFAGAVLYQKGFFSKDSSENTKPAIKETASTTPADTRVAATSTTVSNQNDKTISIQSIDKSMVGETVSIVGEIINHKDHKNGHVFLTVKDASGEILIPIFADKNINTDTFVTGNQFQFAGNVDEFNGEIEIIPSKQEDIVPTNPITRINEKDEGQLKTISGKIISKYTHPQGHIFITLKVQETGQELEIPLFSSLHPNPDEYPINSEVNLKGKVTVYKNRLQIIPNSLNDLTIIKEGDDSSVSTVKLSAISEADRGKMVITRGQVTDVSEKNGHLYFKLSAGGKNIKTVLFKADSQEIAGRKTRVLNAEKAQFEISVLGMVDVYKDELEIIIDKVLVD